MVKRTGPSNDQLKTLIIEMKKKSIESPTDFWKKLANSLEKPTRQKIVVNLSRISKYSKENDTVIVPGKVLGDGILDKKVNIAAFSFSQSAKDKIAESKSQTISLEELMKKDIKLSEIKIIG